MTIPSTTTLYQYWTVRHTLTTLYPQHWGTRPAMTQAWHHRIGKLHLSHLRFVFPARSFPTYPSEPLRRTAYDGLRPKTYPPQRYLERADLTQSAVFKASIINPYHHQHGSRSVLPRPAAMI
jgi:hypothetical protein